MRIREIRAYMYHIACVTVTIEKSLGRKYNMFEHAKKNKLCRWGY